MMLKDQKWLDQNYPKNGKCQRETKDNRWDGSKGWDNKGKYRKEITKLNISNQDLKGGLKLIGFENLKRIDCSENKLSSLDLSNCPSIKRIYCQKNRELGSLKLSPESNITYLDINDGSFNSYEIFDELPTSLVYLDIRDNLFSPRDLSFLSKFVNLEILKLGRKRAHPLYTRRTKNIPENLKFNAFTGSLEPLKNLPKLSYLSIFKTDIGSGLEFLPSSLEKIRCGGFSLAVRDLPDMDSDTSYRCQKIYKILEAYDLKFGNDEFNLQAWRKKEPLYGTIRELRDQIKAGDFIRKIGNLPEEEGKNDIEISLELVEQREKWFEFVSGLVTSRLISELVRFSLKLKAVKEGKLRLLESVFEVWEDHREKIINELEGKIVEENREIRNSKEIVRLLRKELNERFKRLGEEIISKEQFWEKQRKKLELKIEVNSIIEQSTETEQEWWKEIYNLYLEEILKCQEEITRVNSKLARDRKNKLSALFTFISEFELEQFCNTQEEIIKLEMQRNAINKSYQIFSIDEVSEEKKLEIAPIIPDKLLQKIKNKRSFFGKILSGLKIEGEGKVRETYEFEPRRAKYDKIYPVTSYTSSFREISDGSVSKVLLPFRLYNVSTKKIEKTEGRLGKYFILSYVWGKDGELPSKSAKKEVDEIWKSVDYTNKLNPSGYKSLKKAIEFLNKFKSPKIEYIWMDQLCINQKKSDSKEKEQEILKMRQYYGNASVTLVSIQTSISKFKNKEPKAFDLPEILTLVISSQWFERSWTYQEGWLSKQTIFMFDDYLIDGQALAANWVLCQPSYTDYAKFSNLSEFNQSSKKVATPLGWTYCEEKYASKEQVSLRLDEALRAIKIRKRGIPADGIYSILGLLPYGNEVTIDYKESLEKILCEVAKISLKNGYGEVFSWYGDSRKDKKEQSSWMPIVYTNDQKVGTDNKRKKIRAGGTNVEGGIDIKRSNSHKDGKYEKFEISVFQYIIEDVLDKPTKLEWDDGFAIEGGTYMLNITIKLDKNKSEEVTLLGTSGTFKELMEANFKEGRHCLIMFDEEKLVVEKNKKIALFTEQVREERDYSWHCRLGLVELFPLGAEKLTRVGELRRKKMIVDVQEFRQFQIQAPPKTLTS